MRNIFILSLLLSGFQLSFAQSAKQIPAVRTTLPIKIDGELKDEAWRNAQLITGFVEQRPTFGRQEDEKTRTEVYLLYDNEAIYFGGILRETKDSLSTELAGRDNISVNDFIGVVFDTYQDRINGLGFFVTPLGEQSDIKYSIGSEDNSWNAVYHTETKITSEGWSFEMRIPYSAIRFSKNNIQNWGLQIVR